MKRPPSRLVRPLRLLALCSVPALLAGGALLVAGTEAAAHEGSELHGTLTLMQEGRRVADGVDQAVVFFTPAKKPKLASTAADALPEMKTLKKAFTPRVLVVAAGSKVRFPNQDPILHNAFSVSAGNAFDVGLYGRGSGKTVTMKEPGLVRVFCNVHQQMAGYVLVVDTPYSTAPDKKGGFALTGLPSGPGTLSVWHERGELVTQAVTLPAKTPLTVSLAVSKPRVPRHLNKFGKAYSTDSSY